MGGTTTSIERLLKILSSAEGRFRLEEVALKTGLSLNTVRKYVGEMVRQGLVAEQGEYYVATDKALLLLEGRAVGRRSVGESMAYVFTDEKGAPIAVKIDSVEKLYIALRYGFIPKDIVMHHISRGYIIKWLTDTVGAKALAQRLLDAKSVEHLVKILEEYLGLGLEH